MAYIMTDDQQTLVNSIKAFMEKEVNPHVAEFDESGRFPKEIYQKMFEMGLHCMGIPEEFGGGGLDTMTVAMLMEEMSKVDAGVADTMAGVELALNTVLIAGNDAQKKLFADVVIPGNFAAFCLTEPDAGSDAAALKTVAIRDGEEYVLDGRKCFITNGGVASIYIVFAMTDKSKGTKGVSAFIVERDRPGLSVGKEENKMGIRASNTADVVFEGVRVPADHLVGQEGKGFRYAMQSLDKGRIVAEVNQKGDINVGRFGPKTPGCGGFINISQNTHKVVFCGSFTAGGLELEIGDGKLKILQEGRNRKFVEQVQQVTYSGEYGASIDQDVLYVTERAVFRLTREGLTLIEIAPGINLEKDVLGQMGFRPIVSKDLKEMDARIFRAEKMGWTL